MQLSQDIKQNFEKMRPDTEGPFIYVKEFRFFFSWFDLEPMLDFRPSEQD